MKASFAFLAAMALACVALPSHASEGEPWMCHYKGYTADGQYYYIAVKPFDGPVDQGSQLNDHDFARALFDDLAPGNRFSGEIACAQRPREMTEVWWDKMLAGDDMFSSSYNTTLAEWRDGHIVEVPWPK